MATAESKTPKTSGDTCPECGIDLNTGKMPEVETKVDRRSHAIAHWGTDNPASLDNPDARARAEKVLGGQGEAKREG